jgi:hypothetical protein
MCDVMCDVVVSFACVVGGEGRRIIKDDDSSQESL